MYVEHRLLNTSPFRHGHRMDYALLWVGLILLSVGLVMVYSATISGGEYAKGNAEYFLIRQAAYIGFSLLLGTACGALVSMHVWQKITPIILAISLILLFLVLWIGTEVGVTKRWIPLGIFNIQPSEFFKLASIFYLASFLTRRHEILTDFRKVRWGFLVPAFGIGLIYLGGDFGTSVIIFVVASALLLIGGLRIKWFLAAIGIGMLLMTAMIVTTPHRVERIMGFWSKSSDIFGAGFQPAQASGALARAGWDGIGLGRGLARYYLPEIHTDYIFALTVEELGIVLGVVLMCAYTWLAVRAFMIGSQALKNEQYFSAYVAKGICVLIAIQSFLHFGVNLGFLPSKGLTLPLISYGGTSMLVSVACLVLLLRIDYENRLLARGWKI